MKYQKRNKSRIRENENTLFWIMIQVNKKKKDQEERKNSRSTFSLEKDCGCEGYLNQENKDAVMKKFHFLKTDEMPHWIRVKETF